MLTIEDKSKIHAIRVPSDNSYVWKWRVWIPSGKTGTVNWYFGPIPHHGLPNGAHVDQLDSGEQLVTLELGKEVGRNGSWQANLRTPQRVSGAVFDAANVPFIRPGSASNDDGVFYSTAVADNTLTLHRLRLADEGHEKDLQRMRLYRGLSSGYGANKMARLSLDVGDPIDLQFFASK